MQVEWVDIKGYESIYKINKNGEVLSLKKKNEKKLSPIKTRKGYFQVRLYKDKAWKSYPVHRLVAMTFIKTNNLDLQVNHIDGNKRNNAIENLEWVTNQENAKHAFNNKLRRPKYGSKSWLSKLTESDVIQINQLLKSGNYTDKEIADKFGVSRTTVNKIKTGKNWNHLTNNRSI